MDLTPGPQAKGKGKGRSKHAPPQANPFYIVPGAKYEYAHPEVCGGRGEKPREARGGQRGI